MASAPRPYMLKSALIKNAAVDQGQMLRTGTVLGLAFLGFFAGLFQIRPSLRARNSVEGVMLVSSCGGIFGRHPDDGRHRAVDAVRDDPFLPTRAAAWTSSSAPSGIRASRLPARPAAPKASSACCRCCGARSTSPSSRCWSPCRSACFSAIYMSEYAIEAGAHGGQAAAGDPGRHPDHRLRLLRARHVRPVPARSRRLGRPRHLGDERADGGLHHGRHADPVRLVAVGRHHQRRAAVAARRFLRTRRHAIGDDQARRPARGVAGHRRRHPACRLARHRRDDDRRAGRRHCREPDRSIRSSP